MTFRDQIDLKIRKLTRAIEAVADLPTLPHPGYKFLSKLKAERTELRIALHLELTRVADDAEK
jgi:hypothetical protein